MQVGIIDLYHKGKAHYDRGELEEALKSFIDLFTKSSGFCRCPKLGWSNLSRKGRV